MGKGCAKEELKKVHGSSTSGTSVLPVYCVYIHSCMYGLMHARMDGCMEVCTCTHVRMYRCTSAGMPVCMMVLVMVIDSYIDGYK